LPILDILMQAKIVSPDPGQEFSTQERCHILEVWNSPDDPNASIARARVEPGVTTKLHALDQVEERYVILSGTGRVEVGDVPPTDVSMGDVVVIPANTRQRIVNTGDTDLVFYAICTPRFTKECYRDLDSTV
jgi:mannose-6-phosphate isomerase-like protein (cupin superfamily)